MIKYLIISVFLVLTGTTEAHFFDGEDQRINFTGEGYPFRAIGKLTSKVSNDKLFVCTAFLTGPDEITTARHCLVDKSTGRYVKEVLFELPDLTLSSHHPKTNLRIKVQVPQYGEKWKFETESAVSLDLDWTLNDGIRLGDLVGYFGVSGLGTRKDGYPGELPNAYSSKQRRDFCKRDVKENRPLKWLYDQNASHVPIGEEWTASPEEQKTIVKICSAGFVRDLATSRRILMVENSCGLGGALFDGARTNCWTCAGVSGGPLFYFEDGRYYAIAVHSLSYPTVQNAKGISRTPDGRYLIGEPFGSDFFNFVALIIPDVYGLVHNLQDKGFYPIRDVSIPRSETKGITPSIVVNYPRNK